MPWILFPPALIDVKPKVDMTFAAQCYILVKVSSQELLARASKVTLHFLPPK